MLGPRVFSTRKTSRTFSGVIEYITICSLTTCKGYCSGRLNDVPAIIVLPFSRLENCIVDIYTWCGAKRLQLNADKTELLWFGPTSQLRQLPSRNSTIHVNQSVVKPVAVVRDLGVWFDAELSMRSHVSRVAQTCFCLLYTSPSPRDS